ncbi:MAG: hypothetical protein H6641_15710 [Caldilineaceae bacterium]|nr:hypothetical protein [Caldilineaceae bacterium]
MNDELQFNVTDYRAEDGGVLDAWADLYGANWLFVTGYDCWFYWNSTHWQKDEQRALQRQIEALLDAMNQAARAELAAAKAARDDDAVAMLKCYVGATKRSKSRVASVVGMAEARRAVPADILNSGNVLNLKNGLLDLTTYEIRPHSPTDYQTYLLDYDYDPAALAPRFEQYLAEVQIDEETGETDGELCTLTQELMGYSLTNETNHEAMSWLSGEGGNGKTVLITVIQWLLGPLCCSVDFQFIGMPGNYDIAEIQGKRVIFSTESERGGRMAEGYIKRIVSGERINARPIYGSPFEFKSTAKIWWAMNDKPIVRDTGNAIWRRLKLIPFNRTFSDGDRDVNLLQTLEGELSGILNFALDGLRRLRQRGRLPESAAVAAAVAEYKHESNPVSQWVDEETSPISGMLTVSTGTLQKSLYENYAAWCNRNGRQELNSTNFGKELKRLRVPHKRGNVGMIYALLLHADGGIRV